MGPRGEDAEWNAGPRCADHAGILVELSVVRDGSTGDSAVSFSTTFGKFPIDPMGSDLKCQSVQLEDNGDGIRVDSWELLSSVGTFPPLDSLVSARKAVGAKQAD